MGGSEVWSWQFWNEVGGMGRGELAKAVFETRLCQAEMNLGMLAEMMTNRGQIEKLSRCDIKRFGSSPWTARVKRAAF